MQPDYRKSTLLKHGKRADARKRKLSFLAFPPDVHRNEAHLSKRVATLEKELETSKQAQTRLTAELAHVRHRLAQANAKLQGHEAERRKAVQRYADITSNYAKLADKYNLLCTNVQEFICPPIDPYGTFTNSPLMAAVHADLAKTQERRLCAQLGATPLPPPPAQAIDAHAPCS
jgi:septal ring factor EnvC (AmiA/AmiB activator)